MCSDGGLRLLDASYQKRLTAAVARWLEAGYVTPAGATAILASLDARRSTYGMASIAGTLGAVLLGLGAIVFVGANWEEIPRAFRFGVLLAGMATAYAVAAVLSLRGHQSFADAALLVAGLVFAASIVLVGQTYHLTGEFAGAILMFVVGALAGALLTRSATLAALALIAGGYWTWIVLAADGGPHWGGLAVVLAGGALMTFIGSGYGRILAILAIAYWVAANLIAVAGANDWPFAGPFAVMTAIAALAFAIGAVLATFADWPRLAALGRALLGLGLVAILLAVGVLQAAPAIGDWGGNTGWLGFSIGGTVVAGAVAALAFVRRRIGLGDALAAVLIPAVAIAFAVWQPGDTAAARLVGGIIVVAAAVWAIVLGQSARIHGAKGLGFTAFGLELVYLYAVTLGTMIDTALAFLLGGILFIAVAYGLFRIDRRLGAAAKEATP